MARGNSLGSATIALELEYAKVSKGLDQVNRQMKGFSKGLAKIGGALKGAFAVGSIYGFNRALRSTLDELDKIGKTAAKIGLTTDALQELRFAAEQSGVQVSALDMGMQRFVRRTAEAAKGGGVLFKEFSELNIALKNTDGSMRGVEDVLSDYADAIANAGSEQEQLRLAFAAFDSEGAALVNLFREGSGGVKELRQELRDLGGVMDANLIQGAERANDAMNRASKAIGGAFKTALASLAPAIERVANWIVELNKHLRIFFESLIPLAQRSSESLTRELASVNERVGTLRDRIAELEQPAEDFIGKIDRWTTHLPGLRRQLEAAQERQAELRGELDKSEREADQLRVAAGTLGGTLGDLGDTTSDLTGSLQENAEAANEAAKAFRGYGTMVDKVGGTMSDMQLKTANERLDEIGRGASDASDSLFDLGEAMRSIQNNFMGGLSDTIYDTVFGSREQLRAQKQELRAGLKETLADIADAERRKEITVEEGAQKRLDAERRFNDDMGELVKKGTKSWSDRFKDFARDVLDSFKRLFADIAAAWATSKILKLFNIDAGGLSFDLGGLRTGGGNGSGGITIGAGTLGKLGKEIGTAMGNGSGVVKGIATGVKNVFSGVSSTAAGNLGFKGPAVMNYAGAGGSSAAGGAAAGGASAGAVAAGAAVVAAIAAYGFGQISKNKAQRRERQQEFFTQVGTGTSVALGESGFDFRGQLDGANAFFSTVRTGWQSTIAALEKAEIITKGWGASLDENGRGLIKIRGDIDKVKQALEGASVSAFAFHGNLGQAEEKGNRIRVSLTGNFDVIKAKFLEAGQAGLSSFTTLQRTSTGASAVITGDWRRWAQMFQSWVNQSIHGAITGVNTLTGAFQGAAAAAREVARASVSIPRGPSFEKFATGGITHRPAIFGEAGPEAAVPLPDGRTIPVTLRGGMSTAKLEDLLSRILKHLQRSDITVKGFSLA